MQCPPPPPPPPPLHAVPLLPQRSCFYYGSRHLPFPQSTPVTRCLRLEQPYARTGDPVSPGVEPVSPVTGVVSGGVLLRGGVSKTSKPVAGAAVAFALTLAFTFAFALALALPFAFPFAFAFGVGFSFGPCILLRDINRRSSMLHHRLLSLRNIRADVGRCNYRPWLQ